MKIFVAGATGTLGLPFVRALAAQNHEVTGLTRSAGKRQLLEEAGAVPAVADVLDSEALAQAVRRASPDCIVHLLTALPRNAPFRTAQMRATNELRTTGTANLLRAAIAAGARRIVAESMIFAYGFGDHGAAIVTEADPLQLHERNAGLQEVVDALRSLEDQILAASRQGSIEAVALRFALFYGLETPSTAALLRMIRRRLAPTARGANGLVSWIHIRDAVSATVKATLSSRAGEIYNIADDEPAGMNEWIRYAAQATGAPLPPSVPFWILRWLMPYIAAVFETRLPVSNRKAKQELGWQPQFPTYRDGLLEAAANLKNL